MAPRRKKQRGPKGPESPGKFMIQLGGFLGFSSVFFISLATGGDMLKALVVAMLACLACAFIMKIFACYVEKNIDEMLNRKADEIRARREREEAEEDEPITIAEEEPPPPPQVQTAGELDSQ